MQKTFTIFFNDCECFSFSITLAGILRIAPFEQLQIFRTSGNTQFALIEIYDRIMEISDKLEGDYYEN